MGVDNFVPSTAERGATLQFLVPDSGRTWSVLHDEIRQIPADAIEVGDVFIVRHATEPGVMFMQATAPFGTGWRLKTLELATGPSQ